MSEDGPRRHDRRTLLTHAAGLAAAGLALDGVAFERILAAVQRVAPAIDWMWSGGITPTTARVRTRSIVPGPVRLIVSADRDGAPSGPVEPTGEPSTDGVVTFEISGLQPDTAYRYQVETAAGRDPRTGHFRTFKAGPLSCAFAFGSCASTGSGHYLFETVRRRGPLFFLHLGDFHYENIGVDDPWRFRDASNRVLRSPTQSALYRQVPIVYVYDDHDFGRDDSDGTSITKAAAQLVYRERVPHYPLPLSVAAKGAPTGAPPIGPVAQAFDVGRARVIVTDGRSERTPQSGRDPAALRRSMLGQAQRAWFRDELTRAADTKAPIVFWGCGVPWITKASSAVSVDGWNRYQHERAEIAGEINKLGLTSRLIILSGDAHMAAIDDGTNSNYVEGTAPNTKGPVVVQAAPFSRFPRAKGGPYSHGQSTRNHQFGWVEIEDDGGPVTVKLSCRNASGLVIPGLELTIKTPASS